MSDELIGILATVALITGGGLVAYWRYLLDRADKRREAREDRAMKLSNGAQRASDAAWKRLVHTVEMQGTRIDALETRVKCCEDERDLLREQNKLLEEERDTLRELLDRSDY